MHDVGHKSDGAEALNDTGGGMCVKLHDLLSSCDTIVGESQDSVSSRRLAADMLLMRLSY